MQIEGGLVHGAGSTLKVEMGMVLCALCTVFGAK